VHLVALSWSASTDNVGVTGYKIYRNGAYLKTVTGTSYTDGGLAANTTYSYKVSARDAAGMESTASGTASAITTDSTPPTAPTLFAKVVNATSPYAYWSASSDDDKIARYDLYRNGVLIASLGAGQRNYTDKLAPRGTLSYRVVAYDPAGHSTGSNTASLTF
jgi:fibronectin type 3 domain-containing protein